VTGRAARRILRRQGMPSAEIHAVLAPGDPVVARRILELHRERLEEWIGEQRALLARVEDSLLAEPCTASRRWDTVPRGDVVPR
jgi:hypothetical protein